MTRQECEKKLLSLAEQMRAVYEEYNPVGDHLGVIMSANGYINVSDCFFTHDGQIIHDVHDTMFKTVDVSKYDDGHVRYNSPDREAAA